MILLVKREPLGGKGLTGPICPSLISLTFSPRPAKTIPFVILLCLTLTISLVKREPLGGKGILVKIKDGGADLRRTQINMVKSKAY